MGAPPPPPQQQPKQLTLISHNGAVEVYGGGPPHPLANKPVPVGLWGRVCYLLLEFVHFRLKFSSHASD
jgi:hypothetical protein